LTLGCPALLLAFARHLTDDDGARRPRQIPKATISLTSDQGAPMETKTKRHAWPEARKARMRLEHPRRFFRTSFYLTGKQLARILEERRRYGPNIPPRSEVLRQLLDESFLFRDSLRTRSEQLSGRSGASAEYAHRKKRQEFQSGC
jgi:hypothetical protein